MTSSKPPAPAIGSTCSPFTSVCECLDNIGRSAKLPMPQPPEYLLARTSALVAAERDRRQGAVLAGASAIFACALVLLIGQTLRILVGDSAALGWLLWALVSSTLGAASALVLASRRLERSIV